MEVNLMATRSLARSGADEDLDHGEIVIITTRWILVVAGLLFALWNPAPIGQLRVQIAGVLGLAALNFFLHGALGGGCTKTLRRDLHGKAMSGVFLDMMVDVPDDFTPPALPV